MGNAQILSKPASNSKFKKYQTSQHFMIIHQNISSKSRDLTQWFAIREHQKHIYDCSQNFKTEIERIVHDGICNDKCQVLFKAQKYEDNIYDEIEKRKRIGNYYTQEQIWFMMLNLVKFARKVYKYGSKWIIGNIHPKNILINQNGLVKIISLNSFPYERDHYEEYRAKGFKSAFISPELIGFTYNDHKDYLRFPYCVNKQISETFTIGLTLFSMCILETDLKKVYDLSYYEDMMKKNTSRTQLTSKIRKSIHQKHGFEELLNKKLISYHTGFIIGRYSNFLAIIIEGLINPNPQQRLSIFQLYEKILRPNQGYILGMELDWLQNRVWNSFSQHDQHGNEQVSMANSYLY